MDENNPAFSTGLANDPLKGDIVSADPQEFSPTDLLQKISNSPEADPQTRLKAINTLDAKAKADADALALERSKNVQKYLAQVEVSKQLNEKLKARNNPNLVDVPTPDKFGVQDQDVTDYLQQIAKESNTGDKSPTAEKTQAQIAEEQRNQELVDIQNEQAKIQEQSMAAQVGAMAGQQRFSDAMQRKMDEQIKLVENQQTSLDSIDPERFWKTRTTGQTIMGALGVLFGGLSGKGNVALDVINNAIKNDIDAQKTTNENKLALQQNALKRVQLEIDKFSNLSQDQMRKAEMAKISAALQQQRMELAQKQVQTKLRSSLLGKDGIPVEMMGAFDEKERERAIILPNGKFAIAPVSAKAVQEVRKDLTTDAALFKNMEDLTQMAKSYNKLDLAQRAAMDTKLKLSVGNVKKLVGESGAMTESDRKFILQALGDPNFTPNMLAIPKFNAISNSIKGKIDAKYKSIGVTLPKTREEILREGLRLKGHSEKEIDRELSGESSSKPEKK